MRELAENDGRITKSNCPPKVRMPLEVPTLGDFLVFKDWTCNDPTCLGEKLYSLIFWPVISLVSFLLAPLIALVGAPVAFAGLVKPDFYSNDSFEIENRVVFEAARDLMAHSFSLFYASNFSDELTAVYVAIFWLIECLLIKPALHVDPYVIMIALLIAIIRKLIE